MWENLSLKCEYCRIWFHIDCEGTYRLRRNMKLSIITENNCIGFCKACNSKSVEVFKLVQGLKDKHDQLESKVDQITIKIDEIRKLEEHIKKKYVKLRE